MTIMLLVRRILLSLLWVVTSLPTMAGGAPPLSVRERLAARTFPSIFQAWTDAAPVEGADPDSMLAWHDPAFLSLNRIGLAWEKRGQAAG